MADFLEERKVSARELLGTSFPEREVRAVPAEKIAIHVYSIGPNQQRENLTGGQPIEGYLDREDLEKQFGVGRYLLVAKNKDNGTVITQATVDVTKQIPHPLAIAQQSEAEEEQPQVNDQLTEILGGIMQRMEELEKRVTERPRPEIDLSGGTLTEKLLMRMIDDKGDEKKSMAEQMNLILRNALDAQKEAIKATTALSLEEKRDELATRREERKRRWEREDLEFESKARLVAQRLQNISGQAMIDPDGGNTMSLVEAIKDIIGTDNSLNIFGFDLTNLLEPIVPQLAKALEDRGLYIVDKKQMEMIINSQFERGRLQGQDEAFNELLTDKDQNDNKPEVSNGPDGGQSQPRAEDNPGPDDRTGGEAGS